MKTRKRRPALKCTAMSGFCQKKMQLTWNTGSNQWVSESEKTRSSAISMYFGLSCLLSLPLYDRGVSLSISVENFPEIFIYVKIEYSVLLIKSNMHDVSACKTLSLTF